MGDMKAASASLWQLKYCCLPSTQRARIEERVLQKDHEVCISQDQSSGASSSDRNCSPGKCGCETRSIPASFSPLQGEVFSPYLGDTEV